MYTRKYASRYEILKKREREREKERENNKKTD
jgi:hypothetical protein